MGAIERGGRMDVQIPHDADQGQIIGNRDAHMKPPISNTVVVGAQADQVLVSVWAIMWRSLWAGRICAASAYGPPANRVEQTWHAWRKLVKRTRRGSCG